MAKKRQKARRQIGWPQATARKAADRTPASTVEVIRTDGDEIAFRFTSAPIPSQDFEAEVAWAEMRFGAVSFFFGKTQPMDDRLRMVAEVRFGYEAFTALWGTISGSFRDAVNSWASSNSHTVRQGDIIDGLILPIGHNPTSPNLFTPDGNKIADPEKPLESGSAILLAVVQSPGLILSQTCDIQRRPFITVARIHRLAEWDKEFKARTNDKTRAEYIRDTYDRAAVQPSRFYLQESQKHAFPKSVASFLEIASLAITDDKTRDYLKRRRVAHLTAEATGDLQFRLAYYFGRYATSDLYMLTPEERALLTKTRP